MKIANEGHWGVLETKQEEVNAKGKIRVLFLDCDGVINNMYQFRRGHGGISLGRLGTASVANILPLCKLIDILCENGYYIVYSTAWNISGSDRITECLSHICDRAKLDKVILGCTPYIYDTEFGREGEIQHFIDTCGVEIEKFAIIDDCDIVGFDGSFVKTEDNTGMLDYHVMRTHNILTGDHTRHYV